MKLSKNFLIHLIKKYQTLLKNLMKGSEFMFDNVHLLCYECHKINFKRAGSCIDSPDCIKI